MSFLRKIYVIFRENGLIILFYKLIQRFNIYYFNKLIGNEKWKQASFIGGRLIALYPQELWIYQRQIECYRKLKDEEQANQLLEKYLNVKFNGLTRAMEQIKGQISFDLPIKSEYVWLGGGENNGFIEHTVKKNKYLTKITSRGWRERLFYLEIYNQYPGLQEITPKMVSLESNGSNIYLITTEKIEGKKPGITDKVIREVIKKNCLISSIKYDEINHLFTTFEYKKFDPFKVLDKEEIIFVNLGYLNEVHKKLPNRLVLSTLQNKLEELNHSLETIGIIKRLEKVILKNNMYEMIIPNKHYSLQHSDLKPDNMIIDGSTGKLLILDWGRIKIGPRWNDIAGFLGFAKLPFHRIRYLFLENGNAPNYDLIEKLFFIYTLILVWFNVLSKDEFDNKQDLYLKPAIEHLEFLGSEIIKEELSAKFA
jgi:serine/threonine protein kinase